MSRQLDLVLKQAEIQRKEQRKTKRQHQNDVLIQQKMEDEKRQVLLHDLCMRWSRSFDANQILKQIKSHKLKEDSSDEIKIEEILLKTKMTRYVDPADIPPFDPDDDDYLGLFIPRSYHFQTHPLQPHYTYRQIYDFIQCPAYVRDGKTYYHMTFDYVEKDKTHPLYGVKFVFKTNGQQVESESYYADAKIYIFILFDQNYADTHSCCTIF
jgi:hypothetical protein